MPMAILIRIKLVLYFSDNIIIKKEISISCYDKKIRFKFKNKIKFISDKDKMHQIF